MTSFEAVNYIHSLGKFRLPPTLDRMKTVCARLGDPQNAFVSVHIAGTNGKGSTAAMISDVLMKSGKKVGLYISPFVVCFNERISVNGEYISDSELAFYTERVRETGISLNEFEFITAVGFLYFKDKKIDIAVMETGLGGRLDATNVLENVALSVITKIGLDHTSVLGETVGEITAEKCGIIKQGVPVVTVCNQDKNALSVIRRYTEDLTVAQMPGIIRCDLSGNEFIYKGKRYTLSLPGEHQIYNAACVIEAVHRLLPDMSSEDVKDAISKTVFPARLETVSGSPLVIIDGAHNPDGARALAKFLRATGEKVTMVCAMMRDKNCREFVKTVSEYTELFIATEIDMPRCLPAGELKDIACGFVADTRSVSDLNEALSQAEKAGHPVFVAGSLYLASKARKYYKK